MKKSSEYLSNISSLDAGFDLLLFVFIYVCIYLLLYFFNYLDKHMYCELDQWILMFVIPLTVNKDMFKKKPLEDGVMSSRWQ